MEIQELQASIHEWAESKGWNDPDITSASADPTPLELELAKIALIHLRLSEELELLRAGSLATGFLDSIVVSIPAVERVENLNATKVLAKLALVHSEISEAVRAVLDGEIEPTIREGKPEGLGSELDDTHIRLFHLAAMLGHDTQKGIELKMEYNASRPEKHGKLA